MDRTTLLVILFFCISTTIVVGTWLFRLGKRRGWWGVTPAAGQPPYYKAHPVKFGLWTVAILWLLAVGHLLIWGILIEAPKAAIGYTLRTVRGPEAVAIPQGKSVGGPLRWSQNAKVNLKATVTTEDTYNGRYFVGPVPPGSHADLKFFPLGEVGSGENYLVENPEAGDFQSSTLLRQGATEKHGVSGSVFPLPLVSMGETKIRIKNVMGMSGGMPNIAPYYVQVAGAITPRLRIEKIEPADTHQYLLEVGANTAGMMELPKSFKWLWIVPVHHSCYQSQFLGNTIPATGLYYEEAQKLVQAAPSVLGKSVQFLGNGYDETQKFQAILLERNGERTVLSQAVLLQAGEANGPISLRLNIPTEQSFSQFVRPAKIIVGVQL